MPTDLVAVMTRKREALRLERFNRMILMGCCIACLVQLILTFENPELAGAVELLILE